MSHHVVQFVNKWSHTWWYFSITKWMVAFLSRIFTYGYINTHINIPFSCQHIFEIISSNDFYWIKHTTSSAKYANACMKCHIQIKFAFITTHIHNILHKRNSMIDTYIRGQTATLLLSIPCRTLSYVLCVPVSNQAYAQ